MAVTSNAARVGTNVRNIEPLFNIVYFRFELLGTIKLSYIGSLEAFNPTKTPYKITSKID